MLPPSVRWRLPLSYALIALLAAVALGLSLVVLLRRYYQEQEVSYLRGNAETISRVLAPMLAGRLPAGALQSQLEGFAFLTQTRVRLTDASGTLLADSGAGDAAGPVTVAIQVAVGDVTQAFSQTLTAGPAGSGYRSLILVQGEGLVVEDEQAVALGAGGLVSQLKVVRTPFGVALGTGASTEQAPSSQTLQWPVVAVEDGTVLGTLEFSEGPAYGRAIVRQVAAGWALSSMLAVAVAGGMGWWISRGLTLPLLALGQATARMAAGDLTVRAHSTRRDELGALADAFNSLAQRTETLVTTLRQFVSDAAHALNTPLTVLSSDLALIAAHLQEPEQQARAARARGQVERLEEVAAQLLDLSRVEAGHGARVRLDWRTLVLSASEPFASWAEQKGVTIRVTSPDRPVWVDGDERQLRQAVANVLDNAVKFTPSGGQISMRIEAQARTAVLTLTDTGIGIPAEDVPRVLDRFHRGGNAAEVPGSGLGLAIVKAVAEAHGGSVSIAREASGTRVSVILPLG